jgi:hypothetical protein
LRNLSFLGRQSALQLGDLLLEIHILLADLGDLRGILNAGIRKAEGKVDLGFLHGGQDFFPFRGIGAGFQILLVEVDGTYGITQFIAIEQANLQISLHNVGVGRDGLLKLLDSRWIIQVGDIFAGLTKERIPLVFRV